MNKKILKLITAGILTLSLTTASYAVAPGFYIGANAGKTNLHNVPRSIPSNNPGGSETLNPSNIGGGLRIYLGDNLNNWFGLEGGYTAYAPTRYTIPVNATNGNPLGQPEISEFAFDFVATGRVAIPRLWIGAFAKAGVAILKQGLAGTFTNSGQSAPRSTVYFKPTASLGLSYDLTQSWVLNLTVARVFGSGGLQNADLYSLGMTYHVVDKFCGQFLC